LDAYVNKTRPAEKQAMERVKKIGADPWIQMVTQRGSRRQCVPLYIIGGLKKLKFVELQPTHYVDLFNRLLRAAPILRTSEQNQNVSTIEEREVPACRELSEPCNVVAETAEKNVAMVDMLRTLSESRFCSYLIAGIPVLLDQLHR
jgi:hypothetical protein